MENKMKKATPIGLAAVLLVSGLILVFSSPNPLNGSRENVLLVQTPAAEAGEGSEIIVAGEPNTVPPVAAPALEQAAAAAPENLGGVSALIPVTGGPARLECRPNTLELPGGSRVVVRGLCGDYWAAVQQESRESLPPSSSLYTFVNGITLMVLQGSELTRLEPVAEMPPGANISVYFLIQPEMAQYHLVGLRLEGDSWQDAPSARAGLFMEIPGNRPGTYVMAAP